MESPLRGSGRLTCSLCGAGGRRSFDSPAEARRSFETSAAARRSDDAARARLDAARQVILGPGEADSQVATGLDSAVALRGALAMAKAGEPM